MLILEDFTITVSLRNRFGMCCSLLPSYSKQFITALLHREQFSYFHMALHTLLNCHKPVPMGEAWFASYHTSDILTSHLLSTHSFIWGSVQGQTLHSASKLCSAILGLVD